MKPFVGAELWDACQAGDAEGVRCVISASPDLVHTRSKDGLTALHVAAAAGDVSVVSVLLDCSANANAATRIGVTPLHMAARGQHTDVAKLLLDRGADVDQCVVRSPIARLVQHEFPTVGVTEHDGCTPLLAACDNGSLSMVRLLIGRGANVNARTLHGINALHAACGVGHESTEGDSAERGDIVCFLALAGANVNEKARNGTTALHWACRIGAVAVVCCLLDACADVNAQDGDGYTPLILANSNGHAAVVLMLMSWSVDSTSSRAASARLATAHANDSALKTACVSVASPCGNLALLCLLLCSLDGADRALAFHVAWYATLMSRRTHAILPLVALMHALGADLDDIDGAGRAMIHEAAVADLAVLRLFLDLGVDCNVRDREGSTPLLLACRQWNSRNAALLLRYGADASIANIAGLSVAQLASADRGLRRLLQS